MYQLLVYLAILLILWIAFPLGWRVSKSVPDEVPPARVYIEIGIDVLFFLALAFTLYGLDVRWIGVLVVLAALIARKYFEFVPYFIAASGIVLGLATLASPGIQGMIAILTLAMNFLLGATTKQWKSVLRKTFWQPVAAVIVSLLATIF
jgi:hypothetical protein